MEIIIRTRGHAKADGLTPEVIDEGRIYGVLKIFYIEPGI